MTDDDTDTAQKAIDDAVKSASPAVPPAIIPPEPEPLPVVPTAPEPTPEKQPDLMPPSQQPATPITETGEKLMSDLLEPTTVAAIPEHKASEKPLAPSGGMKKQSAKGGILIVIATLLLTLPVAVFFLSKQNQQLNDVRSRAAGNVYNCKTGPTYECCIDDLNTCAGQGGPNACHCLGGQDCTGTKCEDIETNCRNDHREWCDNSQGFGKTCCAAGYVCCSNTQGCCSGGGPTPRPTPGDDDTTNPTPTPTTGTTPVCQNIKIYKDGTQVTNLPNLRAGDHVVLAVKGNLAPSKAHFRVNGGAWTETTTKNAANEFTRAYTIPDGIVDFVIEGEVFTNGAWR